MSTVTLEVRADRACRLLGDAAGAYPGEPSAVADALLGVMHDHVPASGGALLLTDPDTLLFTTGAVVNMPPETCHPFFTVELSARWPGSFRELARTGGGARALLRRGGADDPIHTGVLQPHGFVDELRVVCRDGPTVWGGLFLWRAIGEQPFDEQDEAFLDRVAPRLACELRDAVAGSIPMDAQIGSHTVLLVIEDGRVVDTSEDTPFSHELADPGLMTYRHLEHLVALAACDPNFSTVLRTRDGAWLAAHASPLGSGRVALMLSKAGPADLFSAVVRAAGLSDREVEVTRLLCRGLSDAEIAAALHLSPHTVHDHVRAVRGKLGVRSRGEVAARIFADHYLGDFLATAAVRHTS